MKGKVAIIGGGTAGLIAAKRLSEYGIETNVYDQKKRLGYPARASGILSIKGLESIGVDYKRAVTNTLYGARIHAGKEMTSILAGVPVAHVLDRIRLNEVCCDEAVSAGARVTLGGRINAGRLEELSKSSIVIGADGLISLVAKHFLMGEIRRVVLTYKAEFNVDVEDSGVVELFFDKSLTTGLFGWLCPNANDILEVGIGIDSGEGNARTVFERFMKNQCVIDAVGDGKMLDAGASIIPLRLRKKIVDSGRRVLLVGDAAGQVKPSTGGGIVFGGNAAIIASKVIREHLHEGTDLNEYKRRYYRKYMLDTMTHSLIRRVYSGISQEGLEMLIRLFNRFGVNNLLGRYGDMDMPTLTLKNILSRNLTT